MTTTLFTHKGICIYEHTLFSSDLYCKAVCTNASVLSRCGVRCDYNCLHVRSYESTVCITKLLPASPHFMSINEKTIKEVAQFHKTPQQLTLCVTITHGSGHL